MGEELGWLVSPFVEGFYYGYLATHDSKLVEMLIGWPTLALSAPLRSPTVFSVGLSSVIKPRDSTATACSVKQCCCVRSS